VTEEETGRGRGKGGEKDTKMKGGLKVGAKKAFL